MNAKVNPYQAVSIQPSLCACLPAQLLRDKRFLCREAPVFPLPDCTQASDCECKYKRWEDRRQDDRRAPFATTGDQYFANGNRRQRSDRRSGQSLGTAATLESGKDPKRAAAATKGWGLKSFIQAGLNSVMGQTKG